MLHANAPLSFEGRCRLIQRCQSRPIAHVGSRDGDLSSMRLEMGQQVPGPR